MMITINRCTLSLHGKRLTQELNGIISCKFKTCATRKLLAARKVRYLPVRFLKKSAPKREPKYIQDEIDQSFRIIFFNNLYNYYVYGVPIVFVFSTVSLGLIGKILYSRHNEDKKQTKPMGSMDKLGRYSVEDPTLFAVTGACFIGAVLLHIFFFTRNQILRMYYNNTTGEYAARLLRYGVYRKTIQFTQSEIEILPKTGMGGNVKIQGRRVLLHEKNFMTIADFNRFMRYDIGRPSDYQRELMSEEVSEIKKKIQAVNELRHKDFEKKFREERKVRLAKRES